MRAAARSFAPCPMYDMMLATDRDYLLSAYLVDMTKYATTAVSAKIIETWENLPSQLAKESGSRNTYGSSFRAPRKPSDTGPRSIG